MKQAILTVAVYTSCTALGLALVGLSATFLVYCIARDGLTRDA